MQIFEGMDISDQVIAGLKLRYPNTAVDDQLALMALWLAKNPASRPKRGIRFVENWLKKSSPKLRAVPKIVPLWWQTDKGTSEMASSVGVTARPGEEMREFRQRIMDKVKAA